MPVSPWIVAILNQKGGVAKTTTTANLGACLAGRGYQTLLIDMDPQANLTLGLGVRVPKDVFALHHVLQRREGVGLEHIVVPIHNLPLYLIPASFELGHAEAMLTPILGSGYRLKEALDAYLSSRSIDFILIDCPPSLGRLTELAIVASTHLLIPTEPKLYSFSGMDTLNRTFSNLHRDLNLHITLLGVLLTMYEKRTRLHRAIANEIRKEFGDLVFQTTIRRTVRLSESELEGKPAILLDPSSGGAQDYDALTDEVLQRVGAVCKSASTVPAADAPTVTSKPDFPSPPMASQEIDQSPRNISLFAWLL